MSVTPSYTIHPRTLSAVNFLYDLASSSSYHHRRFLSFSCHRRLIDFPATEQQHEMSSHGLMDGRDIDDGVVTLSVCLSQLQPRALNQPRHSIPSGRTVSPASGFRRPVTARSKRGDRGDHRVRSSPPSAADPTAPRRRQHSGPY